MENARTLFLNAARQRQAVFVPVHVERDLIEQEQASPETKRAGELSQSVANALTGKVPMLITTLSSKALIKLPLNALIQPDKYGITVRNGHFSAIDNPKHQKFLKRNKTSVALISGTAVGLCVDWTIASCIRKDITPIVIMDATDLGVDGQQTTPANRAAFERAANEQWQGHCLTTCTSEVEEWAQELAF